MTITTIRLVYCKQCKFFPQFFLCLTHFFQGDYQ
jgi:hypothetical protein